MKLAARILYIVSIVLSVVIAVGVSSAMGISYGIYRWSIDLASSADAASSNPSNFDYETLKQAGNVFLFLIPVAVVIGVVELIFSIIGLRKLQSAKSKDELTGIAICNIIFGPVTALVAGIFCLCLKPGHFASPKEPMEEEGEVVDA